MTGFLIGLFTAILMLDAFLLVVLVLAQPSKKEAGMGSSFGGATDVLLGAGSGNVLTKITKYAAAVFLALCLIITIMNNSTRKSIKTGVQEELNKGGGPAPTFPTSPKSAATTTAPAVTAPTATTPAPSNSFLTTPVNGTPAAPGTATPPTTTAPAVPAPTAPATTPPTTPAPEKK